MKRAERNHLGAVIGDVRAWSQSAQVISQLAAHLPLSTDPDQGSDGPLLDSLDRVVRSGDLALAEQLTTAGWLHARRADPVAEAAAERLTTFHGQIRAAGTDVVLATHYQQLVTSEASDHDALRQLVARLGAARADWAEILTDVYHMPVTRAGVLTPEEDQFLRGLIGAVDANLPQAWQLLDRSLCPSGACAQAHASARLLAQLERDVTTGTAAEQLREMAHRVRARYAEEKQQVALFMATVAAWKGRTDEVLSLRADTRKAVTTRVREILGKAVTVDIGLRYRLVPLGSTDVSVVRDLARLRDLEQADGDEEAARTIATTGRDLTPRFAEGFNADGTCRRDESCVALHNETRAFLDLAAGIEQELVRLGAAPDHTDLGLDDALDSRLRLVDFLPTDAGAPELLGTDLINRARGSVKQIAGAAAATKAAATEAKTAADAVHAVDVTRTLRAMDLDALKKASGERVRIAPLTSVGLDDVWAVFTYAQDRDLAAIPGLGEASALAIEQAARRLFEATRQDTPVRIDVKRRDKNTGALLDALRRWHTLRGFTPSVEEVALARSLNGLFRSAKPVTVVAYGDGVAGAAGAVAATLEDALRRSAPPPAHDDVWSDFLARPADYFGMLTELGFLTEDEKKMHGDLPEEIIEAVRGKDLKRDHLRASLRTYQSFGARFALVQEKVVIGDEMGLGKTVEALAVLSHLRSSGHSHFLVICPAAVVSNWIRETTKHTKLGATRLHGPLWEREASLKSWTRNGGVAVTTYDLLPWLLDETYSLDLACAVFDEAHYIKNPGAKRSVAAAALIETLKHVILMTGTPLENKVQDFRNLIGYIRSDLAESAPEYLPSRFRKHVAPAYLRRNQEDVMTELPELVEIDEWTEMSASDEAGYRSAVEAGQFMTMRRAAMLSEQSQKMDRLLAIVEEAEANGRRVIVFSYFRDVLSKVAEMLPGNVFGPLTGSVPARDRQELVDDFSKAPGGAVLVSQITAGGVGLNIQSASVVVICEPQIKPTMETQAIARAHRMGQTSTVQVHRLLTENSVDERIREILEEKLRIFDDFARTSVIADRAPEALDMTDAELARQVIAAEREHLGGS